MNFFRTKDANDFEASFQLLYFFFFLFFLLISFNETTKRERLFFGASVVASRERRIETFRSIGAFRNTLNLTIINRRNGPRSLLANYQLNNLRGRTRRVTIYRGSRGGHRAASKSPISPTLRIMAGGCPLRRDLLQAYKRETSR